MEIKRGEIWSVLWVGLSSKPRPALVIHRDEKVELYESIVHVVSVWGHNY
jgi:mRNA-degrading endonuclease toxin of MazEF toxin-antitoxin module